MQRQPTQVQRAFQNALEQSTDYHVPFDHTIIATLIDHGADAASVYLPGLFSAVIDDSFGLCRAIADSHYVRREKTWRRRVNQLVGRCGDATRKLVLLALGSGPALDLSHEPSLAARRPTTPWLPKQVGRTSWLVSGLDPATLLPAPLPCFPGGLHELARLWLRPCYPATRPAALLPRWAA